MFPTSVIPEITNAARAAGHDPAAILAVAEIESGGRVFARVNGRDEPLIRFEGHYFDRRLSGRNREMARAAGLADPRAGKVANPVSQAARHALLARAEAIDAKAARESCSWGIGQVMGAHWAWLGYASVDALVAEARSGAAGQVRLMLAFIEKSGLSKALAARDWAAFAKGYNGPAYASHGYHVKLAAAYRRHAAARQPISPASSGGLARGDKGAAVATLQRQLTAAGYPVAADGDFGARTEVALDRFRQAQGLPATGRYDEPAAAAMEKVMPLGPGRVSLWSLIRRLLAFIVSMKALRHS